MFLDVLLPQMLEKVIDEPFKGVDPNIPTKAELKDRLAGERALA